VTTSHRKGNN